MTFKEHHIIIPKKSLQGMYVLLTYIQYGRCSVLFVFCQMTNSVLFVCSQMTNSVLFVCCQMTNSVLFVCCQMTNCVLFVCSQMTNLSSFVLHEGDVKINVD